MMALDGIRVLDAASMMAGPYGATLLGDMGADVIKLEPPNGDETRRIGPRTETDSGVFVGINRNKRSIAVDLRTDAGREVLGALVDWADVLVENLRPRAKQALGLDWESLHARNPRLVSVGVSTFGADGPVRRPARHRSGRPGAQRPAERHRARGRRPGEGRAADRRRGQLAAGRVRRAQRAVGARAHGGGPAGGRRPDRRADPRAGAVHGQYFLLGRQQPRMGNSIDWYAPYNAYRCADGRFVHLACYNDKFFRNLCAAIERPELADDERFRGNPERVAHRDELDELIAGWLAERPRDAALEQSVGARRDRRARQRLRRGVRRPAGPAQRDGRRGRPPRGPLRVTGVPVRLSATPGAVRRPPPALGEHTAEVLAELGLEAGVLG